MNPLTLLTNALNEQALGPVLGASFAGGILSSLLPCTLGMLPIVVGYVVGDTTQNTRKALLAKLLLFIGGLATTFTLLGISAALLGLTFGHWLTGGWLVGLVGMLTLVMGGQLLGWWHVPLPSVGESFTQYGPLWAMARSILTGLSLWAHRFALRNPSACCVARFCQQDG